MCVLISFQHVSQNFLIISNIEPDDTTNVKRSDVKHWLLLSDYINFIVRFSKNPQTFQDKLFIAEGQTERGMGIMSLTVVFRNFGMPLQT